ncbi:hypothetical protein [Hyalangium rubrum]|uniref:Lipoprotein n=1 Tax=Hyalangium rubrum TaxID=3103134 RepID=A0ABU5HDF6_9BACT|nr:hypothetical protein [Hyalangium sp. s54d21]MDY7231503.1 hypothetical protein [Hyalangium sp. s54d21]
MRRSWWSLGALVGLGLAACTKDAPLESEGVLGGRDVAEFRGTVTAVSGTQFILRDSQGEEHPFEIDDKTDFFSRGKPVERLQLQEGKQVRTVYDEREGEWVAHKVEIVE